MFCSDCKKPLADYPHSRAYQCSECLSTLCIECYPDHIELAHTSDSDTAREMYAGR